MRLLSFLTAGALVLQQGCAGLGVGGRPSALILDDPEKRPLLQDVVTWDEHSLFIRGERVMIFSGEFHPFRLPVPSLWLDVFQKIKAAGLNAVSFYVDWALLEGKPGNFTAEGVFDLEPFFQAAKKAGIYLIARPGPYINAEASGGGFPGWLQRVKAHLRTNESEYLVATDNYMANIGRIIAKAQITNGGPVILVQPENEYSGASGVPFPVGQYMQYVEDQLRRAGVVVPLISNDASAAGHNAPGTGVGEVDIYGHDSYPLGFDCANPYTWPARSLPTSFHALHEKQSPSTPYSLNEFQGGSFDPPGGLGFEQCSVLLNNEFERVFYKNNFAAGATIFNIYMLFGGTNWGNLGHPGGYTSYDYGASIKEDRTVGREKYSELKLEAQFLKVSPGYLVANPSSNTSVYSTTQAITTTPVLSQNGSFFVVRHTNYSSTASTSYNLTLSTSAGNLTVPQLGGSLTLNGRDSKIHVTDYPVGNTTLLYSTAEILTWHVFENKTVLVVYGGAGELHELALKGSAQGTAVEGSGVTLKSVGGATVAHWTTVPDRRIVQFGSLYVYVLDRNSAYNYWVPETGSASIIVNGGYLVRSASVSGGVLSLTADFNKTTTLEIIGVPSNVTQLHVNGADISYKTNDLGSWVAHISYANIKLKLPDLKTLDWVYVDSLPEITESYDDRSWPKADHATTNNTLYPLKTPVSLYGSDYGFHTGALLFRGQFTAQGSERTIRLRTMGGQAFGYSVWLNSTFLGSWAGIDADSDNNSTWTLPPLDSGRGYVLTLLLDNMGLDENWIVGEEQMKSPRGILQYALLSGGATSGRTNITKTTAATTATTTTTDMTWRLTGNIGGEDYADRARGPLNEGGLFAERQGYHLPSPPAAAFRPGSPFDGIAAAGVGFYTAKLALDLPAAKYDIPVAFTFVNSSSSSLSSPSTSTSTATGSATGTGNSGAYRALLYVNGFQFGRYTSNIGPQTTFPVPEGVLNYRGDNWIAVALWALDTEGARLPDFYLDIGNPVLTGREPVTLVEAPAWTKREGAY